MHVKTTPEKIFRPMGQALSISKADYQHKAFKDANAALYVYPLNHLSDLVEILTEQSRACDFSVSPCITVSYLIDTQYRIWFSMPHLISKCIPEGAERFQNYTTGICVAAGNVSIDQASKEIVKIDVKNDDYHVEFNQMQLVIAILVTSMQQNNYPTLASQFIVEEEICKIDKLFRRFELQLSDMQSWIYNSKSFDPELLALLVNSQTVCEIQSKPYHPPQSHRNSFFLENLNSAIKMSTCDTQESFPKAELL